MSISSVSSNVENSAQDVYVSLEFTPNPNTLKYSVNRQLLERGAVNFVKAEDVGARSPLATKLFAIPGICGVMLGRDFITVTKTEDGDWDVVHKTASETIHKHLSENGVVMAEEGVRQDHKGGETEIENKIREILDRDIRPAVAMDGGDITFEKFEDGVVYLYLQGSCSGCPSSTATLKMGIETRLREAIPEVVEVVAV
ncbi:MAG: NifU family protein [Bdellovibrionia bacterium]